MIFEERKKNHILTPESWLSNSNGWAKAILLQSLPHFQPGGGEGLGPTLSGLRPHWTLSKVLLS